MVPTGLGPGGSFRLLPAPLWVGSWVLFWSAVGFLCMAWDKWQARRGGRRVPERTLLGLALLGGSPGVALGIVALRHKIRKPLFWLGVPALMVLQLWWAGRAFLR
ncbi:MAG: DUF1294 domain-containing protein [Bacillota bacterium]|nr:MAG: DUF1294 domain-containing protein [Bacillota bacterium]